MPTLTFLGTGTSNGVPMIGCECPVCRSSDPRDRRSRSSAVVQRGDRTLLIDTAPELRLQAMAVGLRRVDAVLITHPHADHIGGFDDLRRFNELMQQHLPVYAEPGSAALLRERYGYTFVDQYPAYGIKPDLRLHEVAGPFAAPGGEVIPIPVHHGRLPIVGYRFDDLAYVTDAKTVPDESVALLRGVKVLVVNALRERPHPTHFSFAEALAFIERVGPHEAYLTHLSHETSHADATARLPPHVHVAYDGLTIGAERR
ncbi:MAG: MBL fold metallo-hydrolase [Thermomicrobiales bacterium]|nr:MBL fold metallo-hydrolase [Thermomicrobiales bacterium]